jgi:hypothetical protein
MFHLLLDPAEVQWIAANHSVVRVKEVEMTDWPHAFHGALHFLFLSHLDFGGKKRAPKEGMVACVVLLVVLEHNVMVRSEEAKDGVHDCAP